MTRSLVILAVLCAACDPPPPRQLIVRAGRLFNGIDADIATKVRIVIVDGLIDSIEPDEGPLPPSDIGPAGIVDARELTVLPGLIDTHTHLAASGACTPGVGIGVGQMARNLYALLAAGVTTAADLGAPPVVAIALRRWSGTGRSRGPRLLVAGPMLTEPNGYMTDVADGELVELGAVWPIESPAAARAAVRKLVDTGVDLIKVGLQIRNFDDRILPPLRKETLCAIVEEAHRQELRVLAHATETKTWGTAIECRVDGIVHGLIEPPSEDLIARVKEAGIPVASTLFVFDAPLSGPKELGRLDSPSATRVLSDAVREDLLAYAAADATSGEVLPGFFMRGIVRARTAAASAEMGRGFATLHQAGIPLAMGSDSPTCFNYVGDVGRELGLMVESGMSAAEALTAATYGSARMLNLHQAIGRVAVGYRADLIAVAGVPDEKIADIERVRYVIIDGLEQRPEAPGVGRWLSLAAEIFWAWVSL